MLTSEKLVIPRPHVNFQCEAMPLAEGEKLRNNAFTVERIYYNGLKCPIIVGTRDGLTYVINPSTDRVRYKDGFVVQERITFHNEVIFDTHRVLDEAAETNTVERNKLRESAAMANSHVRLHGLAGPYGFRRMIVDRTIAEDEIRNSGGLVYFKEMDITIGIYDPQINYAPHPYSREGIRKREIDNDTRIPKKGGIVFRIEIVDNDKLFSKRFVNINNIVYQIDPQEDPDRDNGVYLYESGRIIEGNKLNEFHREFYSMEEADAKLNLHRTAEDALALGNLEAAREREHKIAIQELRNKERQLLEDAVERKARHEAELTELKEKKERAETVLAEAKLKMDQERLEMNHEREMYRMKEKDRSEKEADRRRDFNEFMKWLPVFVIAVGAVVTMVVNNNGKDKKFI